MNNMEQQKMKKIAAAGLEPSTISDPRTGRQIRIAVPVRIKYRKYFQGQEGRESLHILNNRDLNDLIAHDFAAVSNDVVHMFVSKDSDLSSRPARVVWMEIRKQQRGQRAVFNFFLSKIHDSFIDILDVIQVYKKPTKPRIVTAGRKEMLKNLLDIITEDRLEKMAKKGDGVQGQNVDELIASVKAAGKRLSKSKKEINDVVAMIKGIEESGKKYKKSKEYIRRTINDKLPSWCIKEKTKYHGQGKSGPKAE